MSPSKRPLLPRCTPISHALVVSAGLALSTSAIAQTAGPSAAEIAADEEAPPPPVVLRHVPPRFSWEFGFGVSYGNLPQFNDAPPYVGFGLRAGWGRHFGKHRIGAGLNFSIEGPVTIQWANVLEPVVQWDYVSNTGLYLGASLGPSLILNADVGKTLGTDLTFDAAPMAAFRIGYSQPWSLIARRFFVGVEPKVRIIDGRANYLAMIVIGTGMGY